MYIKELHIKSFGALIEKVVKLDRGLNVVEGANECGKSTLAMFIKFVLYGLSGKAAGTDTISEKEHYVNWDNGLASGYIVAECRGGTYIIERKMYRVTEGGRTLYRESERITDTSDGSVVKTPKSPGEYFFGFPEKVFMQSAFVKNIDSAKVDGVGLKVALENLLTSGDEQINTKRALEKLDGARKLLLHRNGSGGRICELESERDRLRSLLADSQSAAGKTVELEGQLSDIEVKREARETEAAELTALCDAYEAVRIGSKVKSIESCEAEVKELSSELDALDPEVDAQLIAKIDICESTVKETENDIETLSKKRAELSEKYEGRDTEKPADAEEVTARAKKLRISGTFCLALGCALAVLTLIALVLLIVSPFRTRIAQEGYLVYLIIGAVALGGLCGGAFSMFARYSSAYEKLLSDWDAEDEESLKGALDAKNENYEYTERLLESIKKIDSVTEEAITKHDREIDRGMEYGRRLGAAGSDNVFEVLSEAKEKATGIITRREELTSRLNEAKGRLSAILEDVSEEDRGCAADLEKTALARVDRDRILAMTKDDYNKLKRARDFAASTAASLKERQMTLEKDLAALGSAGKTPSEIAGRISVIENEIEQLTSKHRALVAAYTALEAAGEKMRADVMPEVAAEAARIMGGITDGKYGSLSSGENFDLTVTSDGQIRTVDFLSEGTKDASYISVRAALVKVMYSEETPPMIFDECFARLDRARLCSVMEILAEEGMPQSVVFTCRTEEITDVVGANMIRLPEQGKYRE